MKHLQIPFLVVFTILFALSSTIFYSCDPDDDDEFECDSCHTLYKPNIYIYPTDDIKLDVKIHFPNGGEVIKSIPEYNNGWSVNVTPEGLIDGEYTYLFYESVQPFNWQDTAGWVIPQIELGNFFSNNMKSYGFNNAEIKDFIDYWIPKLNDSEYYAIYPQDLTDLNEVINLEFSVKPDNLFRLFYVVKKANGQDLNLKEPVVSEFKREKFHVIEWGVLL